LTLTARAHQQRKSDTTRWYIIPANDWPAFAYGRYFADWDPLQEGSMRLGAMLEKGLGQKVAPDLVKAPSKGLLMKRNWKWRDVILEGNGDLFVEPIVNAAAKLQRPILLQLEARQLDPSVAGDPYDGKECDRLVFEVTDQGAVKLLTEEWGPKTLQVTRDLKDIDDVYSALRELSSEEWVFLSALAGITIRLAVEGKKKKSKAEREARLVTTHELWESLLAPFEDWLVS
jgi:hypothetical protein